MDIRHTIGALGGGVALALVVSTAIAFEPSGELEIHYINVGQGGSTLIIGPNGTRILYDFGNYDGNRDIVPYLRDVLGLVPEEGLHYAIVSHRDKDHYTGYKGVVDAGYNVIVANYGSGSAKPASPTMQSNWLDPANDTTAGAVRPIPVGLTISLGDGAEAMVIAASGRIYGDQEPIEVSDENDHSVVLFVRYGAFQYLLDGDLGGGAEECTHHQTGQRDVQTHVAEALLRLGLISAEDGVDVLHIAHHGSESSTPARYYNLMRPEVGLISVGLRNKTYMHPRADVVDNVLLADNPNDCVEAPPLMHLFQTEDGEDGCRATGCTSNAGLSIGDIVVTTDGRTGYSIRGDGRVYGGDAEMPPGKIWAMPFDEMQ